tara:strand:+ start:193 stop:351 length:159 start_codon:yes stop_codon:yes gene_type:complete
MGEYNDAKRMADEAKELQRQNAERLRRKKMNADGTLKGFDDGYATSFSKKNK